MRKRKAWLIVCSEDGGVLAGEDERELAERMAHDYSIPTTVVEVEYEYPGP